MTYEELKRLPLLDAVIRETLRRHPPIHSIMVRSYSLLRIPRLTPRVPPQRKVISDMVVPPSLAAPADEANTYVVPRGHFLLACPAVSHMDAQVWTNPDRWDPYRWTNPSGVAAQAMAEYDGQGGEKIDYGFGQISKGTESTYQPFGAGRHRCIGEQVRVGWAGPGAGTMLTIVLFVVRVSPTRHHPFDVCTKTGDAYREAGA